MPPAVAMLAANKKGTRRRGIFTRKQRKKEPFCYLTWSMKLILVIFDAANSAAVLHCLVLNSTQIVVPRVDKDFMEIYNDIDMD